MRDLNADIERLDELRARRASASSYVYAVEVGQEYDVLCAQVVTEALDRALTAEDNLLAYSLKYSKLHGEWLEQRNRADQAEAEVERLRVLMKKVPDGLCKAHCKKESSRGCSRCVYWLALLTHADTLLREGTI